MQSIREIYKIGNGPSSSHTMGPKRGVLLFKAKYSEADYFKVVLYGSLALTGKGHLTDYIIKETLKPIKTDIIFSEERQELKHPNTFDIFAYKENKQIGSSRIYSIGGGSIIIEGDIKTSQDDIYPLKTFNEIKEYCQKKGKRFFDYVVEIEGQEIYMFLEGVWDAMKNSIKNGLSRSGVLPGGLNVERKARFMYNNTKMAQNESVEELRLISAYAYAVCEENASGGLIVTSPTCGASGIVPAVIQYAAEKMKLSGDKIIKALASAALLGNIIKTNGSISGAECGCQAEVGSASAMAAFAYGELVDMPLDKMEYAAEIAMEHNLGLTCDPILGLVQIPCIERNVVGALKAFSAANLALYSPNSGKISFDSIINVMYQTGLDMSAYYKETSQGGLAKKYQKKDVIR